MGEFWDDYGLGIGAAGVVVLLVWVIIAHRNAEQRYEQDLLARAHTFADTLQVQQIMAQRRTADAIAFGAGVIAGSQSASPR